MVNSWSGDQVLLPVFLLLWRLWNLLAPLNALVISVGQNVTSVSGGLDLTQMAKV